MFNLTIKELGLIVICLGGVTIALVVSGIGEVIKQLDEMTKVLTKVLSALQNEDEEEEDEP